MLRNGIYKAMQITSNYQTACIKYYSVCWLGEIPLMVCAFATFSVHNLDSKQSNLKLQLFLFMLFLKPKKNSITNTRHTNEYYECLLVYSEVCILFCRRQSTEENDLFSTKHQAKS